VSESHWSIEQNHYGWVQSALNSPDRHRNFLYERLKGRSEHVRERGISYVLVHALAAGLLSPLAIALDITACAARRGATISLLFTKPHPVSRH
jgi:hypothetical protein